MVTFALLAAALTLAAVLIVAIPLLRQGGEGVAPAHWAALAAAAVLVVGSAVLYITWSNWPWHAAPAAGDSPQSMVARLARQLEHNPDDLSGWLMLGRSYTVLQEYPLAVRAFERADRLSGGRSAEALTGEAEALALGDERELDGQAARLIERALTLDPDSGKALFLGGAVAARRGDLALARARFAKLLAMNPPANVRPMLEQQISALDEKLAGPSPAGAAAGAAAGTAAGAAAQQPPAGNAAAGSPMVRVNVTLAPTLAAAAAGSAPLFVFVRDPAAPGPPLAVKRLDSHFPQSVALSPADSMIPGRVFASGQSVQVVARIARSGNPVGASGDPFGEVTYHVGSDGLVSLVIDHVTP
jgi:cytochrome c-type biogenesis protein CcmH